MSPEDEARVRARIRSERTHIAWPELPDVHDSPITIKWHGHVVPTQREASAQSPPSGKHSQ